MAAVSRLDRSGDGLFAVPINANIAKLHELQRAGRYLQCMMAQYEKASGNTIDVSIVPIAPDAAEDRLGTDRPRPDGDYNAGRDGGPAECPER